MEAYIADSIVPWAAEWLLFYEGWHATGEWFGPGLHPGDDEVSEWRPKNAESTSRPEDRRESYRRSADSYIGRLNGTFASFPLMEAASGESSRLRCWPDWSQRRSAVPPSAAISI
jgi:hypothetical protein